MTELLEYNADLRDSQIMCLANQRAFDAFAVCQSFCSFVCHSVQSIYGNPEVATGPRNQSLWTRARENIGKEFGAAESFEAFNSGAELALLLLDR